MEKTLIRIKPGYQLTGAGEPLGTDSLGEAHTFWKSMGHMEVPVGLAIRLEQEKPQRFEMVNRELANKILKAQSAAPPLPTTTTSVPTPPIPPPVQPAKPVPPKPQIPKIPVKPVKPAQPQPAKPAEKRGILNIHIVDNYMGKNTRGILNDIEEDKPYFSLEDMDLMMDYEQKHKKRKPILDKIIQTKTEIKAELEGKKPVEKKKVEG